MVNPDVRQEDNQMSELPISTQWLLNATGQVDSSLALSVVLIGCQTTGSKGTGWLCSDTHIVTNEHVVRGANASDIVVMFPDGQTIVPAYKNEDAAIDIAVLTLPAPVSGTPLSIKTDQVEIGTRVCVWGHPLGYNGPAPILTVGYLAGFNAHQPAGVSVPMRRLVLNAALNRGNSGGPIIVWGEGSVCGVAVTKHAPITPMLKSCITALANNTSGLQFTGTDQNGNTINFAESQLVADVLEHFQSMTQVVIGEAVAPADVITFLDANAIPWSQA